MVSETTQVTNNVNKYIDYTTILSLAYYIIIEPETILLTVYEKDETGNWFACKYTDHNDTVKVEN